MGEDEQSARPGVPVSVERCHVCDGVTTDLHPIPSHTISLNVMNPPEQKLPKFVLCFRHVSATYTSAHARKRKLNDRTLPASILSDPQLSVDSQMYQDLLEMEKKLDWTIMRKKAEVQDALGRTASVSASLLPP